MMRALVQRSLHGPGDMVLTDIPRPDPGPNEYLIRVGAAGLNFADVSQTRGTYGGGPRPPYVAGFEVVGEVIDVGSRIADPFPRIAHHRQRQGRIRRVQRGARRRIRRCPRRLERR